MKATKNIATLGGVMIGLAAFLLCVNIVAAMFGETLYADIEYVGWCALVGAALIAPHAFAVYVSRKSRKYEYQDVTIADIMDL